MAVESDADLIEQVRKDLVDGFAGVFEEIEGLRVLAPFEDQLVRSDVLFALGWAWNVRHVGPIQRPVPDQPPPPEDMLTVPVQFIQATQRELTITGLTTIDERTSPPTFHRFIDWLGLYGALGAVTMARPAVDERQR